MSKLTKENFQKALFSHMLSLSEQEIRFGMNIMGFTLKEYRQCNGKIEFEIHYHRNYIIKAEIIDSLLIFSNQWVIFNPETNESFVTLPMPPTFVDFISLFITMCGDSLLKEANYSPCYIPGFTLADSPEEAKEYWEMVRKANYDLSVKRNMEMKDRTPEVPQQKKKIYS